MSFKVKLANKSESAWTMLIESNGGSDEIEIPPRGSLRMTRCFPITLSIVDAKATTKVNESADLEIHSTTNGPVFK